MKDMNEQSTSEYIYDDVKDLTFSEIIRIQESPTNVYQARIEELGLEEEDWQKFVNTINTFARTETKIPPPSVTETVENYLCRVFEFRAGAGGGVAP